MSWSLLAFLALCFAAATTGSIYRPGAWYRTLSKPRWNPPDWVFPIAWTALYGMMAVAAWLVYEAAGFSGLGAAALVVWLVQLVLNALWSALFFGAKRMDWALWDVAALWLAIALTTVLFALIVPAAAWLMAPYLAWVTFAALLNLTLIRMNSETGQAVST
ncbi:MAG: tryptophan-rich sensory protein [Devosiaceae bacterium]|nr:tryptophan-rich sensory protein [Devosiaceae bacterium MH13]